MNEANIQAAADQAIAASDAASFQFGNTDWLKVWGVEVAAVEACERAAKVGPAWSRAEYRAAIQLHTAFAASAWERLANVLR